MAGLGGIMVDGIKLHAFLLEVSRLIEEAIARDEPGAGKRETYEPGGARHVPFTEAGKTVRNERFNGIMKFFGRARRAVGKIDYSAIMGSGVANALNPKGHGADGRRKLGLDVPVFLESLLKDEDARQRLKKAIAAVERPDDHVTDCVLRKHKSRATYNMIDVYRDLFLVKHPSRGRMLAETKRLVAYLYAEVTPAPSPGWRHPR